MSDFVAIGECMVELAPAGDGLYRLGYAGDTFNAAWYARRLLPASLSVGYGSCVGRDAASEAMVAFMTAAGIDTGAVRRLPDAGVGLYLIRLAGGERSFDYWRSASAARQLADDPGALDAMLSGARLALVSGITLAILPAAGRARLLAALARARAAGTRIAFDSNVRPRLWRDADATRAAIAAAAQVTDIALPSFEDEARLFGDACPEDTAARYRAAGAGTVAVKNGAGRLHLWSRAEGAADLDPERVAEVVDTTAAGDSFDAGFLAALLAGRGLRAAGQAGAALAARVVQSPGALVEAAAPAGFDGRAAPRY